MDSIVFSVGTESGNANLALHPGVHAPPLHRKEWVEGVLLVISGTPYACIVEGHVPANLKRTTELDSLTDLPELVEGDGITKYHVAMRVAARAERTESNRRKTNERNEAMCDYRNRIASGVIKAMKPKANSRLKQYLVAHVDANNAKMFNGPAMLAA